jgi:BASS family bile acid:Na+ symporter
MMAAAAALLILIALGAGGFFQWGGRLSDEGRTAATLLGLGAGAVLLGVAYHLLANAWPRIQKLMPVVSMAGIAFFITMTTAAGRDDLMRVGAWLFLAVAIHNSAGYLLGYWLSRGAGLDKNSARSVAFEVGLQNGAMGSGIAAAMGKLATMGLAPAIFSPWMNISGSILANYWRRRPADDSPQGDRIGDSG